MNPVPPSSPSVAPAPHLITILLGSGGVLSLFALAGSFAYFFSKKQIDALEQANKNLISENERLQGSLTKAEADSKAALDEVSSLFTVLETLRESDLSADDAARIKRILGSFRQIQSMQGKLEAYKSAARWLEYRKVEWVREAVKVASNDHAKLLPRSLRKQFQRDVERYLSWVYTSLYVYGHPDSPIKNFVPMPAVPSSFPYVSAIEQIRNNGDRRELTVEQATYLEKMMDELIKKIRTEFNTF